MSVFDDLFKDLFGTTKPTLDDMHSSVEERGELKKTYAIETNDGGTTLTFELAGVVPSTVSVEVIDQTLIIRFDRRGKRCTQRFTIRPEFDIVNAKATLQLGVLELRMPRREVPKGRYIVIEVK